MQGNVSDAPARTITTPRPRPAPPPACQSRGRPAATTLRTGALEFSATIGATNKRIHGIDLVSLNAAGQISEFTVLARPPNAVSELKSEMMRKVPIRLAKLKAKQALGLA